MPEEIEVSERGEEQSLIVTALLGAAAFTILSVAVDLGVTRKYNRRVRRFIRPRTRQSLTRAAQLAARIAGAHVHPLIAMGIAQFASRRIGRRELSIPLASLGAIAVDRSVRFLIHQKRPPGASRHPGLDRFGFPSGHTCAATAIAFAAVVETRPYIAPDVRRAVTSLGVAAAIGVGWSRLYLDEHWIDDVVGGWIAGITVGASSVAGLRALRRSHAASRADGRGEMC